MTALDALDALDVEKFHTMLLLAADGHVGALQHEIDSGMILGAARTNSRADRDILRVRVRRAAYCRLDAVIYGRAAGGADSGVERNPGVECT